MPFFLACPPLAQLLLALSPLPWRLMMGKTNKLWHEEHRMPKNATVQQRIEWHVAHAKACGCRPIPPSILQLLEGHKLADGA